MDCPVSGRKIKSKKQSHGQRKVADVEEPIQDVVRIGIRSFQGISGEFKESHGNQSVSVLLMKRQPSQKERQGYHVDQVYRKDLPPMGEPGNFSLGAKIIHG